jgi:hypothetical protein
VGRAFEPINTGLRSRRDSLESPLIDSMVAGYGFVDRLVTEDIDLFAVGNSRHLLELNRLVLCGQPDARGDYAAHLAATERRFYEERPGGIADLVEWYQIHAGDLVWSRASGVYTRILSKPQLFIEGNHRTGVLVMSYVLLRAGEPPFVLSVENAATYFDLSTAIGSTDRHAAAALFTLPRLRRQLTALLLEYSDRRYATDESVRGPCRRPDEAGSHADGTRA